MNILIGNSSKKSRHNLGLLESTMKTGGQGDVYFPPGDICIKVLHNPKNFAYQMSTISKILASPAKPYDQVKSVTTVPLELAWDETGKEIVGYTMEKLSGWHGLHEILTEADSKSMGINLQSAGLLLAELCKAVRRIHSQGFVIGDFNPSNVLFKRTLGTFSVKVIDVDSWSIYRQADLGIEYAAKILDKGIIYHPDIIKADKEKKPWPNFTPLHDWWAFACISWMVLTKYDPFTTGKTSSIDTADRCDRILAGNTANSAAMVKLQPKAGPAAQALGPMLRFHLDRHLKGIVKRPFPTTLLEEFAKDLCECRKCSFLSHTSAVICPSCGTLFKN